MKLFQHFFIMRYSNLEKLIMLLVQEVILFTRIDKE